MYFTLVRLPINSPIKEDIIVSSKRKLCDIVPIISKKTKN